MGRNVGIYKQCNSWCRCKRSRRKGERRCKNKSLAAKKERRRKRGKKESNNRGRGKDGSAGSQASR